MKNKIFKNLRILYNDKKARSTEIRIPVFLTLTHMSLSCELIKICMYLRITLLYREKSFLSDDMSHINIVLKY